MSVFVLMKIQVDPEAFRRVAEENGDTMREISQRAQGRGAIHHAFVAGDGEVLIIDEWDKADSFLSFFEEEGPTIGPLMEAAGAQPGEPRFYEKYETADVF